MVRVLPKLRAAAAVSVVVVIAGVGAFFVLTALGVGGGGEGRTTPPPAAARSPDATQRKVLENMARETGVPLAGQRLSDYAPIPAERFAGPIAAFRHYATRQLDRMYRDVMRLQVALGTGDRVAARERWRTAFARYLGLGAVYGAFGGFDTKIDGVAGGLPGGIHDRHFTGLHRIELGLWSAESPQSLVPVARQLGANVRALRADLPSQHVDPLDFSLRAHEILEDAQRDFLTGVDVPYSHEGVLATAAGLRATAVMISTLRPLLKGKDAIDPALLGLSRLRQAIAALRGAHGGRLPTNDELTRSEREHLDASLGFAVEKLQAVPANLETVDPPVIPSIKEQAKAAATRSASR